MNEKTKKHAIIGVVAAAILLIGAYALNAGNIRNKADNIAENKGNIQKQAEPKRQTPQDADMTARVKQESVVQYADVSVHPKLAFAAIVLKAGVSKQDAEAIANKYAAELKTKYADRDVSVQVVDLKGKTIAGIVK